jgi:hypothetical protein
MIAAVVALDAAVLYEKLASSESAHPSFLKRPIIVVQMLALELNPCTNRIGVRAGRIGFLAASAEPGAPGPEGSVMDPHAASSVRVAAVKGRRVTRM